MGDCHVSVAADGRVPHRLAWGQGVVGAERAGTARACCARAVIEHGYDSATVAQIAQRAALTSSTFFRHFTDKREVLYWGQQALPSPSPLQVLGDALDAVGTAAFGWERHEFALRRRAVIATSSELQERQLLKRATLAATVASAFRDRGLDEPAATVVADPGVLAFVSAHERWADPTNRQEFAQLARAALHELSAATTLDRSARRPVSSDTPPSSDRRLDWPSRARTFTGTTSGPAQV